MHPNLNGIVPLERNKIQTFFSIPFRSLNRNSLSLRGALAPLLAATAVTLAACGGGGSSSASNGTPPVAAQSVALSGSAVDGPIAGANITITSGAPLGDTGATTIGTITANGSGGYTVNVTLPTTAAPIFANASDPNEPALVLTSYLGQSTTLASATSQTDTSLPNLDITPVTTAALAVYAQLNSGSYANLTQQSYASTLQQYTGDILAIASAIKAVGDNLCTPSSTVSSTTNLAATIAENASLTSGNSTTLSTAATELGGNCANALSTLPSVITANPMFGPQLTLWTSWGAATQANLAGTYQLQGVIAQTGYSQDLTAAIINSTPTPPAPASLFVDSAVTISSTGAVSSTDGNVSGNVYGSFAVLTVTSGSNTYSLRGVIGTMPSALVTGGTAYTLQAGGINTSSNTLTGFTAVLASAGATPVWNGTSTLSDTNRGVSCATGQQAVLLNGFVDGVGGGNFGECIVPGATGWTMSAPTSTTNPFYGFFWWHTAGLFGATPTLTAATWSQAPSAPFILTDASASFGLTTSSTSSSSSSPSSTAVSGTTWYVMGAQSIVFSTSSSNNTLTLFSNPLTNPFPQQGSSTSSSGTTSSGGTGSGSGSTPT
jgi:hypothetical protein